ncbi:A-kinase anchor protein 9 isoform X3 [Onychomys torridus]|uniref:A-kinase anchor protein 9 isoform X3 n=1 Tax=Onychomys torridus TaxID=38674 RepID=UPI00167F3A0E|nr:A-kinase anchor protein 9 isoform X3 [Onychomys torridus]
MDEEDRQRKLEAGRAKLAQYRQRKARPDGQNPKKQKKKKISSLNINQQNDETSINSSQCVESAGSPDSTRMRALPSGQIENHDQVFVEHESEISTTADDSSSLEINGCCFVTETGESTDLLREEELGIDNSHLEQGAQSSQTCLKMMENELSGKQHEIEELTQQLEEMSGTDVLKRLQEFEAAVKHRDCIITQLIANLQQATKEKDETMKEFLELTEQSKELQIQFQHLQASETLRSSTHSSTAAELLQAKQQLITQQQQLEGQDHQLKDYQIKEEQFKTQITFLQEKIKVYEMEQDKNVENSTNEIREKQAIIEALNTRVIEEEKKAAALKNKVTSAEKLVEELKGQLTEKDQETQSFKLELASSREKEKQCSLEIKQLMGTVEELQKRNYKENLETGIVQRMEKESQRKLDQLQAELDEMYGKQIVQMKQELIRQHASQLEDLRSRHKGEMENTLKSHANAAVSEEQLKLLNVAMSELNGKLQDALSQKEKLGEELCVVRGEKCALQSQFDDLSEESGFLREQIQRARQTIAEQESKLNEVCKSLSTVEGLKAEIAAASETKKELELKHDAEITNYKIKLEMLEKEKNAVLDRMAESQEAELERLRTHLLFSHEEELCKLKDDLEAAHRLNIEKLRDNLGIHHKQQLDGLQSEMRKKMETMQWEKDNLLTKQNQLLREISELRDSQESCINSKSEEMTLQINELTKEIEILRQGEKEKGALEQEIQELQLTTELLKEQLKEKEEGLQEKCAQLEAENSLLADEKTALEDMLKSYTPADQVERLIALKDGSWQEEVEILRKEKEDLIEQCSHLNKEIEKQRNTFSFAEKNFEVNYQELQEEYACLLRVKGDLEDLQARQALEYECRINALSQELHLQKGEHPDLTDGKAFVAEPLDVSEVVSEVVEKDTTELMEKLKVTEREKVELSERLSVASEQLKQARDEVDSLSAEVRLLNQDREQLLLRCRVLEVPANPKGTENAAECPVPLSSSKAELVTVTDSRHEGCDSQISEDLSEESKIMIEDKIPFKESGGEELTLLTRTTDPSHGVVEQCETEKLLQELSILKAKQDDLKLQMEAQRICLSLVYSTYADQVRHTMEKERDEALCSLKDELVSAQEKEMVELHKMHQCQLQALQTQETGDGKEPLEVLIERLQKAVSEECHYISETLNNSLDEHHTPLKCEMNIEEKENSGVYSHSQKLNLQEYRYQVQDFQDNVQTLLSKVTDEYSKLVILQTRLSKVCGIENTSDGQQTDGMKLEFAEETVAKEEAKFLSVHSPANLQNTDVSHESKVSSLPEGEKSKDRGERVQGLENLVSSVQQQLKETEMHSGAEIQSLQGRLQTVHDATVQPSLCVDSVVSNESDAQETEDCGNCLNAHIGSTTEFPGGFEGRKETNTVKLMEKQYQERLEEEIAKVIVSMSIAFAQQTELSRLSETKENSIKSEQAHGLCWQEHPFNDITSQGQVGPHTATGIDKNAKEQFKPLSKELEEHRKEVPLSNGDDFDDDTLKPKDHGLTIAQEIFSKDETLVVRQCIHDEVSNMETSRQLEDMRQELVRQYEEHQQATELLRQAHMQQMERQREDQEQLQEEIQRLSLQLAQKSSVSTENVSERERALSEELEALKQLCLAGSEELCCELRHSSTQTQDENDSQEVEEQTFKEKTLERKPEDSALDENLSNERHALQKANNKLVKILLEVAKTTAAAEETIGCHVLGILDRSSKGQPAASLLWRSEADLSAKPCVQDASGRDESLPSYPGSAIARTDSKWSQVTGKGAELSQQLETSGLAGPEIDPENVELVLNVSSRLQTAVEKLLDAISETSSQLEHAKVTQTELMHESFRQKQEATESLRCLEELHERLQEESRAREQLAVELNRAESIIDGYSDEKIVFEREIQEKAYIIDRLEQELLCVSARLRELEAEQQQMQEEQELLSRQKAAMRAAASPLEQQFLQETEKLMKEKLEVQCQAEKVHNELQKQVKILEIDVEEKTSKLIEMEQEKNVELTDLRQQNQALEKQLEKMRRFIDEQAVDREHERDVFQLEIQKLEQQLKAVPRLQPTSEQQTREVEQLTTHLKEKTDKCSELLLCKEQLQRDVRERNEELGKLECQVRELEQALLVRINDQKQSGGVEAKPELSLEVQLQAERDAIDRKEREISNLEEQLEQFREELENKNEEVQELHMQLEIQRKESTTHLQELQQENKLLKDEMKKLEFALKESNPMFTHDQPMLFGKFAQIIQEKDAKIDRLNEQFIKLEQQLKLATDSKLKEQNITSLQRDSSKVNDQLTNDKEKLSHFLGKENRTGEQENGKVIMSEPLPVDGHFGLPMEGDGEVSSSNQLPQIPKPPVQTELWGNCYPENVTEIISQFTEKIEQTQEIHAAEILNMESRHISEAETLKREHHVAIQLLTEECNSLKKMTQCLKSKQASSIPGLTYSNAHQTREICSSDSESDWGQGFDTASEGQEEGESSAGAVPKVVKGLLRAVHTEGVQMLSIADLPDDDDGEDLSAQQASRSWLEERKAYLSAISSLKDLISKMQVQRQTEVCDQSRSQGSLSDWRGELLLALQDVLLKERSILLAAFQTDLTSLGTRDANVLLNCLERRIQEQGIEYQTAMECLQKADRRSLLAENEALRAQINGREVTLNKGQATGQSGQEFPDCSMQQSCMLEMQGQLCAMKDRMAELQEQLSSEKMAVSELKSELCQTQLELDTTLKAQHEQLKELEAFRLQVKNKADEVHLLSDTLASEHKKSQELQCALATEKAKSGHCEERDKELKDLRLTLEDQKQRNIQLDTLLGQQRQLLNELQQEIESQRTLFNAQLSEEQGQNLELRVLLESEKGRVQEMKDTLDKERELHAQLQSCGDGGQPQPVCPPKELLQELQQQLEEKQKQIIELVSETQKYKLDSLQTKYQLEKDRQVHQKTLQMEKEANTLGQRKMEELQSKVEELQRQLQEKRHQVYKLDLEGKRLQGLMHEFRKQEREANRGSRRLVYQNINKQATWSFTDDRTRNWVLQQKMEEEAKGTGPTALIGITGGQVVGSNDVELIRQKLQHVATKLQQHGAQKACGGLEFEVSDEDTLIWVRERIDRIILRLQRLTGQPDDENSLASSSTSCGSLTETLLRQNSELTGHVNQLTEEKNDLRSIIMKLEEQIKFYQQTRAGRNDSSGLSLDGSANIEDIIASEKEVWNKEKLTLQKSLKRAEAKICELKAELRNDAVPQNRSPDSENAVFKRLYGKYLRAESFRKALVFQKKYLLLLLGRFQEYEEATVGLLARMAGCPGFRNPETVASRPKGSTRFRIAARVAVAVSRMKYLVRRWHQVKGSGPININRDGLGLSPGVEKTDPLYHSSGGLELYGDTRQMTYRSRSDLDFPRSPLPFNRYPGTVADLNTTSLTYPQLQHYNPGRTLTDYVTQMEALQRRLGSTVQSGSPSFQSHAGMRR